MNPFHAECFRAVLKDKKILLGVTGSIAAFKSVDLVRHLMECGAKVRVVLTQNAKEFVTPLTLETLTGERVLSGLFDTDPESGRRGTHHISTARWADLLVIAPCTANVIAKLAHGLADDLLTTEALAFSGQVVIAPAMNPQMFAAAATEANLKVLRERGVKFLGPDSGDTACGEVGLGRMLEPWAIVERLAQCFFKKQNGQKALVTLGATQSFLDPVRYLTNRSGGQMGAAISYALLAQGYEVTVLAGARDVPLFNGLEVIETLGAAQMAQEALKRWPSAQVFVGAAAVLDWDFLETAKDKLKKEQGEPTVKLKKNTDILFEVGKQKRSGQWILGFAAETEDCIKNAKSKLSKKLCDAVFVNDVSKTDRGFSATANAGWWVDNLGVVEYALNSKPALAFKLVEQIKNVQTPNSTLSKY